MRGYIIWDFDGTLGYREGGMWSATLLELLREARPEIAATPEAVRAAVGRGYPWHAPERPHPELDTPAAWWEALLPVLAGALAGVGAAPEEAAALARQFPARYADPARWRLFPDTLPALDRLAAAGWRHVLLSNHVPELPALLAHLGLAPRLEAVFNSAQTGYEKPHPMAFQQALDFIGPADRVWMVGDNPQADIAGAAALGLPGLLVRRDLPGACPDLAAAAERILAEGGSGEG